MLMGRRHEGETEARRQSEALGYEETFGVDRHRHDARPARDETVTHADGAGVFEPDVVAGFEHDAVDEVDRLLGAGEDKDLPGIATDAAVDPQMAGDGAPEDREPPGVGIAELVGHARGGGPCHDPRPGFDREEIEVGGGGREAAPRMLDAGAELRDGALDGPGKPKAARARRRAAVLPVAGLLTPDKGGDVATRSGARRDDAFRGEAIVGLGDRRAGDALLVGENARRRQPRAGSEVARQGQLADVLVDLLAQENRLRTIDPQREQQ